VLILTPTLSQILTITLSLTLNPNPTNPKLQAHILPFAVNDTAVNAQTHYSGGKLVFVGTTV